MAVTLTATIKEESQMKTQILRLTLLLFFTLPPAVAAQVVNIPDPNLRAAVENDLGKASGDTITADDMATLHDFRVGNSNISDLTGLEYATDLEGLGLWGHNISDLSALSGLTDLITLDLSFNSIWDLPPLMGLTNLTVLGLEKNSISDLSPLSGLTQLKTLWLSDNRISDLSPLVANAGLGEGDTVNVEGNPLSAESINTHIPTLQARGVAVHFDAISDTASLSFAPVKFARVREIFRLNVVVAESLLLSRWSLEISYAPKILEPLEVDQGRAYFTCGETSYSIGIDHTGLIEIKAKLSDYCPNRAGDALVSVLFEAKSPGTVEFSLLNVVMLDPLGEPLSNITVQPHQIVIEPSYDLNGDGVVNILDLTLVGQRLGQAHETADVNNDGTVNILDLVAVAQHFSQ